MMEGVSSVFLLSARGGTALIGGHGPRGRGLKMSYIPLLACVLACVLGCVGCGESDLEKSPGAKDVREGGVDDNRLSVVLSSGMECVLGGRAVTVEELYRALMAWGRSAGGPGPGSEKPDLRKEREVMLEVGDDVLWEDMLPLVSAFLWSECPWTFTWSGAVDLPAGSVTWLAADYALRPRFDAESRHEIVVIEKQVRVGIGVTKRHTRRDVGVLGPFVAERLRNWADTDIIWLEVGLAVPAKYALAATRACSLAGGTGILLWSFRGVRRDGESGGLCLANPSGEGSPLQRVPGAEVEKDRSGPAVISVGTISGVTVENEEWTDFDYERCQKKER